MSELSTMTYRQLIERRKARRVQRLRHSLRWAPVGVGVLVLLIAAAVLFSGMLSHAKDLREAQGQLASTTSQADDTRKQLQETYEQRLSTVSGVDASRVSRDDNAIREHFSRGPVTGAPGLDQSKKLAGFDSELVSASKGAYSYIAKVDVADDKKNAISGFMTYTVDQGKIKNVSVHWAQS